MIAVALVVSRCEEIAKSKRTSQWDVMKYLRFTTCLMAITIFVLTVVPSEDRPVTGLGRNFEHWLAFGALGIFYALSFSNRLTVLLLVAIGFALGLELVQAFLPTRHARISDFAVDVLGALFGIFLVQVLKARVRQKVGGKLP